MDVKNLTLQQLRELQAQIRNEIDVRESDVAQAFEYCFLMTTQNKKIEAEPGSTWSLGLHVEANGSLLAMTRMESKTFSAQSRKAAEAWLARRGYRTDGTKF